MTMITRSGQCHSYLFVRRDMKVADIVYENISPLFTGDIRLVEVEYTKKNDGMHLVIYIDKLKIARYNKLYNKFEKGEESC